MNILETLWHLHQDLCKVCNSKASRLLPVLTYDISQITTYVNTDYTPTAPLEMSRRYYCLNMCVFMFGANQRYESWTWLINWRCAYQVAMYACVDVSVCILTLFVLNSIWVVLLLKVVWKICTLWFLTKKLIIIITDWVIVITFLSLTMRTINY